MTWTQAICPDCYDERYPGRQPAAVIGADTEVCCDCGKDTDAGIFFRVDPNTVRFPREDT